MALNLVEEAISHWLQSTPNNYFGLNYGSTVKQGLLSNLNDETATSFIDKMVADIPMLKNVKPDIGIYLENTDMQTNKVFITIGANMALEVGEVNPYG